MTENQKLREAIKRLLKAHRITVQAPPKTITDAENQIAEIQNAVKFAEEALALPTADHIPDAGEMVVDHLPDAGKMIETAAPVGERDAFEKWILDATGYIGASVKRDQEGQYKCDITESAWDAWQARAALSAGDAEDAQRLDFIEKSARCDPKMDGQHVWWPTSLNKALKGPTLRDAIDAAMRKGQL